MNKKQALALAEEINLKSLRLCEYLDKAFPPGRKFKWKHHLGENEVMSVRETCPRPGVNVRVLCDTEVIYVSFDRLEESE